MDQIDHGAKVATIERCLVAISQAHKAGATSPRSCAVVQEVMKGIRRSLGVAPVQRAPVLVSALRAMIEAFPENLLSHRDRALLPD